MISTSLGIQRLVDSLEVSSARSLPPGLLRSTHGKLFPSPSHVEDKRVIPLQPFEDGYAVGGYEKSHRTILESDSRFPLLVQKSCVSPGQGHDEKLSQGPSKVKVDLQTVSKFCLHQWPVLRPDLNSSSRFHVFFLV